MQIAYCNSGKTEAETVETDVGTVEEEINEVEYQTIVEKLKETMAETRSGDNIMFKKTDRKVLKVQADTVNKAIKYFRKARAF